jgi:hypothetical protein
MNKSFFAGLLLGISSLSAQSVMGYMGKRNAFGAEVLISPALFNPVREFQTVGQDFDFYGVNLQVGGTYLFSLSHSFRAGLVYNFEETAIQARAYNESAGDLSNAQTMQLIVHTFGIPFDLFLGNHRAPLGTYFRFQPEIIMATLKNNGGFASAPQNFEKTSLLPGITLGYGVNYVFANRIMLDVAFSGSIYFPQPIPVGFLNRPVVENNSTDASVSRRLTASRLMMLRTGVYFLF